MKKILIVIVVFLSIQTSVYSQSCLPEGIIFETQAAIDSFQIKYPACTEIEGFVNISGDDITNLDSLKAINSIEGNLSIFGNPSLESLSGLDSLSSVGDTLVIGKYIYNDFIYICAGNSLLENLSGLDNLRYIGGDLRLHCNESLIDFSGLDQLDSIGGALEIGSFINQQPTHIYGNQSLQSLSGLSNLRYIGGNMGVANNISLNDLSDLANLTYVDGALGVIYNTSLESLEGLDNIDGAILTGLAFFQNLLLSSCAIQSICDYISNPGGFLNISGNSTGCNSVPQISLACESLNINEINPSPNISIYPMPARQELKINAEGSEIDEVSIYSISGQRLIHVKPYFGSIDISQLPAGMYIIEATIENVKMRRKLLVE